MMSSYLVTAQRDMYNLQDQLSSGQRVRRPSDDPGSYSLLASLDSESDQTDQFLRNADRLKGRLDVADAILQKMSSTQQRVGELIVAGSDSTRATADRKAMGKEVDQLLEDAVAAANTTQEGVYVFGGLRSDVPPFAVTRDGEGRITDVTYQGSSETGLVEIGAGVYVQANIPGSDTSTEGAIFQTASMNVFDELINVRDRLLTGENLVGQTPFTADPVGDTLTVDQSFRTGNAIRFSSTDTLPGGLQPETTYYAITVSPGVIRVAASAADAYAGTAIDITDAGTGTQGVGQVPLADNERTADHLTQMLARIGAYQERVSFHHTVLMDKNVQIQQRIETEGAIDTAAAITELSARKNAYEAASRVSLLTMNSSLLNYL